MMYHYCIVQMIEDDLVTSNSNLYIEIEARLLLMLLLLLLWSLVGWWSAAGGITIIP